MSWRSCEREAVQLVRGVEHAVLQHAVELEVGLDLATRRGRTSPCAPARRRSSSPTAQLRSRRAAASMSAWMSAASRARLRRGRRHELVEELLRPAAGVFAIWSCRRPGGEVRLAEQRRPSRRGSAASRAIVARVSLASPCSARVQRRLEQLLRAWRGSVSDSSSRLLRRVLQRDDPLAVEAARLGRLRRGVQLGLRQAGELRLVARRRARRPWRRRAAGC